MKGGAPVPGLAAIGADKRSPGVPPVCLLRRSVAPSRVCVTLHLQNGVECVSMREGAAGELAARMRFLIGLVVALGLVLPSLQAQAQSGYDRRGGDYLKFEIKSGDPALCASRCERDARCRAWSFSYPRTENAVAVCWLKNKVTPRIEAKCCVSGVRGAGVIEPAHGTTEYSIDRLGGDLRFFDLKEPDADGSACRDACEADNKCRAWTYVRPGYISAAPRCYLKAKITRPRHKPCCISGVVR